MSAKPQLYFNPRVVNTTDSAKAVYLRVWRLVNGLIELQEDERKALPKKRKKNPIKSKNICKANWSRKVS